MYITVILIDLRVHQGWYAAAICIQSLSIHTCSTSSRELFTNAYAWNLVLLISPLFAFRCNNRPHLMRSIVQFQKGCIGGEIQTRTKPEHN